MKNNIKIKKCPKTVTGNHSWQDRYQVIPGSILPPVKLRGKDCEYCGLIDDRKI